MAANSHPCLILNPKFTHYFLTAKPFFPFFFIFTCFFCDLGENIGAISPIGLIAPSVSVLEMITSQFWP